MKRFETSEHTNREDMLIYAGLTGVGIAVVVTALSLDNIDLPISIALYSFAVSIPLLSLSLVGTALEQRFEYTIIPWYMDVANFMGMACSAVGISALFWHFSWLIGALFIVIGIPSVVLIFHFQTELEKANDKGDTQQSAAPDGKDVAGEP